MTFWDFVKDPVDKKVNKAASLHRSANPLYFPIIMFVALFESAHNDLEVATTFWYTEPRLHFPLPWTQLYSPIVAAWSGSKVSSVNLRRRLLTGKQIIIRTFMSLYKNSRMIQVILLHTVWASFCCESSLLFRSRVTRLIKFSNSVSRSILSFTYTHRTSPLDCSWEDRVHYLNITNQALITRLMTG